MFVYIVIFSFSFLLVFAKRKRTRTIGCNLLLSIMAMMCIFRGEEVGIDTASYIDIFDSGYRMAYYVTKDPLYGALGSLLYQTTDDYRLFQALMGIITYLPLFVVFNKKSDNIAVSLLIFVFATNRYFFETFNMVRQAAASSFLLWSWVVLSEKKFVKAMALFVIAVGMHHTSIFYLPIGLFAWKVKLPSSVVTVAVISTLLFSIFIANMDLLVSIEKLLLPEDAIGKYDTYAKELARSIWGLLPVILPYSFVSIFFYKKNKDNFLFRLFAYGTVFANFISVLPMAYRISYGIIILELLIYPALLAEKSKYSIFLYFVVLCLVVFSLFDFITTCDIAQLVPYRTFQL